MNRIERIAVLIGLALLLLTPGCMDVSPWRTRERPWTDEMVADGARVRATQSDGAAVLLEGAHIDPVAGELRGTRAGSDPLERVCLQLDELEALETSRVEAGRVVGNVLIVVGIVALVLVALVGLAGAGAAPPGVCVR